MPIYIGIHTFYDPESRATLIHDWRAPVSSMFYDHELGEAGYRSPSGEIKGVISLKRQYRIRGGKMEFMIESALTVHDDILQKELSSNADDKMKISLPPSNGNRTRLSATKISARLLFKEWPALEKHP